MTMNIGASIPAAKQLVAAVENAGGTVPAALTNALDGLDLLNAHAAPSDPALSILSAAVDGTLDAERLDQLCADAARDEAINTYRQQLRGRAEGLFLDRFHRTLCGGAADEILDSLRDQFTSAANTLAEATALVDMTVDPRQLADHGSPEELAAYRSVRPAVAKLDEISSIAALFGPRSISWAVLDLPQGVDDRGLVDEAVCCCTDGDLVQAGAVFRARTSAVPWLRITPHLNSIAEAKERLRLWAEKAFDATVSNQGRGRFEDGKFVPMPVANPYAASAT
ncbi:hypothetical protein [Mycolicibacterium gadium]|jgi:hypothetical protein|uniref:hypothetical protein n=1 Tax=Mycolicibacterium gadium TaxID=1794 RepID=UPI002FDC88A0